MKCSSFLLKINLFPPFSLVLNRAIPVSINFYLLLMRYIVLLMKVLKLEASSLISQRHLIRCDMMVSFSNWQNGISGNLLKPLRNFLNERKQWVVLNGQFFSWKNVNAGVPQGSILGPLLFLIYINGLTEGFSSNAKLFADDTLSANNLNKDLERISNGLLNGKRTLIQILLKKLKKSFLVAS